MSDICFKVESRLDVCFKDESRLQFLNYSFFYLDCIEHIERKDLHVIAMSLMVTVPQEVTVGARTWWHETFCSKLPQLTLGVVAHS